MTEHLITTPIKADVHLACGAMILTGWAEGLHARVDPTALNPAGEIAAIVAGCRTYSLTRDGLVERDACRIAGIFLRGKPILATHRCGRPVLAEHRAHDPPAPVPVPATTDPHQPPF